MAAAAFAALELLTQLSNLLELVGAPTGGRAFVRAPPPLICPGPGGLRGFVPHVGNVLVLAVVLRPGTGQVSASGRALCGPQLDAMAGDQQENGEAGGGAGLRGIHGARQQTRPKQLCAPRPLISTYRDARRAHSSQRGIRFSNADLLVLEDAKKEATSEIALFKINKNALISVGTVGVGMGVSVLQPVSSSLSWMDVFLSRLMRHDGGEKKLLNAFRSKQEVLNKRRKKGWKCKICLCVRGEGKGEKKDETDRK